MTFEELRLAEPIVRAVAAEGYSAPTRIQAMAIPAIIDGQDVLGCAQTGTGKTGAFALPILHQLTMNPALANTPGTTRATQNRSQGKNNRRRGRRGQANQPTGGPAQPRVLVVCPTRELASQIDERFRAYGEHLPTRTAVIFGGVSQFHQERRLRSGIDILTATPGRLLDLMNQGIIDLRKIETLVLDEADRMLDMGFIRDIRKIVETMPSNRQTLLFSATMPREVRVLADSILRDPVTVEAAQVASTAEAITQSVYKVAKANKPELLQRLLNSDDTGRTLVFSRTKHGADRIVKQLGRVGIEAAAIHGNKSQNARTRALDGFRSGTMHVLVATDIASRGIDVDGITHVINFDMPGEPETYVHRIGRTARAGASGAAVSFCDRDELGDLRAIERLIEQTLDVAGDSIGDRGEPRGERQPGTRTNRQPRRRRPAGDSGHAQGGRKPQRSRRRRSQHAGR